MPMPRPTPIYRLLHIDNLAVILDCGGMYAPNHPPEGGMSTGRFTTWIFRRSAGAPDTMRAGRHGA